MLIQVDIKKWKNLYENNIYIYKNYTEVKQNEIIKNNSEHDEIQR